ncbi:helix-turn-helix domain-containing protein [bacterium]|nr:helix-turn-helix domain-containing protein [bacterium]
MSEYLSKEEIKQWRSSLEKITLEEYAARLGKKIAEDKPTNDLADIVLHGQPVISYNESWSQPKTERITTIAQRAFDREQEISPSPFSISKLKLSISDDNNSARAKKAPTKSAAGKSAAGAVEKIKPETKPAKAKKETAKAPKTPKAVKAVAEVMSAKSTGDDLRDEVRVVFRKALTDREQKVFDYFAEHKNEVVYAKDLAVLLDLPRDYVYKYIKNLRAKIEGEKLENADKGGFILHV